MQSIKAPGHNIVDRIATKLSGGDMVHSAIVLDGYVYEAVVPRVKRTIWADWTWHKPNHVIWAMYPSTPYTKEEVARMKRFADSELGRRYMARGLWQDRETQGTFCSKYASEVLEQSGRIKSEHHRETPQTLYVKLFDSHKTVYVPLR